MNVYSYYTNIYDNKGHVIVIMGNNKANIKKVFKCFNVKVGERTKYKFSFYIVSRYKTIEEILEAQKEALAMHLILKQCVIKDEVFKNEKRTN